MLKTHRARKTKASPKPGVRIAIVASQYNARFVDAMLEAARKELKREGIEAVEVVRVPGAFEIPVVASALCHRLSSPVSAVICLGVILRGATTHAQHIGEAVTLALVELQIRRQIPVIHEVLLLEDTKQAEERCLDPKRSRGIEAARTAVRMAALMPTIA